MRKHNSPSLCTITHTYVIFPSLFPASTNPSLHLYNHFTVLIPYAPYPKSRCHCPPSKDDSQHPAHPESLEPGLNPSQGTHVERMFHPWPLMTFISLFLVPSFRFSIISKIDIKLKKSVLDTSIHLPEQAFMFVQSSQMFVNIETQHKSLH